MVKLLFWLRFKVSVKVRVRPRDRTQVFAIAPLKLHVFQ